MKKFYNKYLALSDEQRRAFDFTLRMSTYVASVFSAVFVVAFNLLSLF